MQQYDQTLPFASYEVNLCGLLLYMCTLDLLLSTLETGGVAVDQSNEQVAISLRDDEIIEAGCSRVCGFCVYLLDEVDVEMV